MPGTTWLCIYFCAAISPCLSGHGEYARAAGPPKNADNFQPAWPALESGQAAAANDWGVRAAPNEYLCGGSAATRPGSSMGGTWPGRRYRWDGRHFRLWSDDGR